jgi:ubiquinone/menaquinone biosynthesis C-methylase UbiE
MMYNNQSGIKTRLTQIAATWEYEFNKKPNSYLIIDPRVIRKTRRHPIVQFIQTYCHLKGDEKVLEAGCGGGLYGITLATFGVDCYELDYSKNMLKNVEIAVSKCKTTYGSLRIKTFQEDLTGMSFGDNTFDIVFNEGVIEHWVNRDERRQILTEMTRVIKPGGHLVVCIPNNAHPFYKWWYFLQRVVRSDKLVFRPGGELEEAIISADTLANEIGDIGLINVDVDGFAVTRTIAHYPRWWPLKALAKALEIILPPFPQHIRKKWGVYLLAGGQKP